MSDVILKIKGLKAGIEGKEILKGIDLEIRKGEIHAFMGPNGAGKSTLSSVLAGKPQYTVTEGTIEYMGKDLRRNVLGPAFSCPFSTRSRYLESALLIL